MLSLLSLPGTGSVKWIPPVFDKQLLSKHVPAATNTRNNRKIVGRVIFYVVRVVMKEMYAISYSEYSLLLLKLMLRIENIILHMINKDNFLWLRCCLVVVNICDQVLESCTEAGQNNENTTDTVHISLLIWCWTRFYLQQGLNPSWNELIQVLNSL
jgi:hypothetical protein